MRYIVGQYNSGIYPVEETSCIKVKDICVSEVGGRYKHRLSLKSKDIEDTQIGVYPTKQLPKVLDALAEWITSPDSGNAKFVMPPVE